MAFDLASVLKDVPDSGTGREQIEYLRLNQLDSDANNFYQLSGVEDLADNIQMCGLQQPIRVRRKPESMDRYVIVSGHRRRAAVELLAAENPERWAEVPCIVERDEVSPALQQLRLIYANANTRAMTPAEISEQAVQVEKLLYQLKEEGYDFPGRMRDHVAKAVGASKSKLSRLKVIRGELDPCWQELFKKNIIQEQPAYELARIPADKQRIIFDSRKDCHAHLVNSGQIEVYAERFSQIDKLKCRTHKEKPCENRERKYQAAVRLDRWGYFECGKCCSKCNRLVSCKYACTKCSEQAKKSVRSGKRSARKNRNPKRRKKHRSLISSGPFTGGWDRPERLQNCL